MKRLFGLALVIAVGLLLVSCGSPSGISDEVYDLASHGLDIVDDYLDREIERTVAVYELDEILSNLEFVIDDLVDYDDLEAYDEDVEWALILLTDAVDDGLSQTDEEEMLILRDELADILGK